MRCAAIALPGVVACATLRPSVPLPPSAGIPVAPLETSTSTATSTATPTSTSTSTSTSTPPSRSVCADGMVDLSAFCMDRFEAPNVRGEIPFALETAPDGEDWCAARGKRLCYEDEWVRACQGPRGRRFPYGDAHRDGACNDDRSWIGVSWKALAKWPADVAVTEATRLLQADMSGARSECVSEEGVYDLTGNVAEWVRRSSSAPRPGYEYVLKGCYWAGCYKDPTPSCAFTNRAHPGTFRTYEAGFRCCSDRTRDER